MLYFIVGTSDVMDVVWFASVYILHAILEYKVYTNIYIYFWGGGGGAKIYKDPSTDV